MANTILTNKATKTTDGNNKNWRSVTKAFYALAASILLVDAVVYLSIFLLTKSV